MTREQALQYVSFVVDDAGNGRELYADPDAIVRESRETGIPQAGGPQYKHRSILVGWQCGFEPMFVAVHSYLDVALTDDEAAELAIDFLAETNWFSGEPAEPDYIL